VLSSREAESARRKGLLEVGVMIGNRKEILHLDGGQTSLFDLARDPREIRRGPAADARLSQQLRQWMDDVQKGLAASDRIASPASMGAEDAAQLRALGYLQ